MKASKALAVVLCCSTLWTVGVSQAAQLGFYAGGHFGDAKKDADQAVFDEYALFVSEAVGFAPTQSSASFDKKDSTYGFVVGYRLFPNLAIEGGYTDLGSLKYRNSASGEYLGEDGGPGTLYSSVRSDTGGIALSALGILPLSYRWEVYGRVGVMFSSNEFSLYLTDGVGQLADSFSESSTDLLAGVGTSFSFAEIYSLRLEFQRFFDAGDEETVEGDVDLITLGVTVAF